MSRPNPYGGAEKLHDGCTVFCSTDDGEAVVFTFQGMPVREALLRVAAILDPNNARGDTWRIDVISTPTTIYRDLDGRREPGRVAPRGHFGDDQPREGPEYPEPRILAKIGRADLWRRP